MRSGRWLHVSLVIAVIAATPRVWAAPAPPDAPADDAAADREVPPYQPPPARFAVVPFENHANVRAFDWLIAGAPFEIAEKTEAVLGLEPTGGTLYVAPPAVAPESAAIAQLAAARGARYVVTGWVERPQWQLRIAIAVWTVTAGKAVVAGEAQRVGDVKTYHQLLGDALAEAWSKAGVPVSDVQKPKLARSLAGDLYAVTLMGRGLGHLTGVLAGSVTPAELKLAEHDLERAVFIDPKCYEAQRLIGELYLTAAPGDAKQAARALAKFNYANDLAPDDLPSLRAAATGAAAAGKHDLARTLFARLVRLKPWDLEARYALGAALWRTGDPDAAERQLEQVTAQRPDHLAARRVLVLIHAARSDTARLIAELEAIAARAPGDLEVKADLASAYGATGQWARAITALEAIAAARPSDMPLAMRIGDARRRNADLRGAITWYARAAKLAPESTWPSFILAEAYLDDAQLAEAQRIYTQLLRTADSAPAAQALALLALKPRPDDAIAYLRRAVREAPRQPLAWQALVAAELYRKDAGAALAAATTALASWPDNGPLHYFAGVAHAQLGERHAARRDLVAANLATANAALATLDAGGTITASPTLVTWHPWGDAAAITGALQRYAATAKAMAELRARYQRDVLGLLGALGKGPLAPAKPEPLRGCPLAKVATPWSTAQQALAQLARLGAQLELDWRYIARHDEAGATQGLLPNARAEVSAARKGFKLALADAGELRAEWGRGLGPELRAVGCTDRLLAAAVADPTRYRRVEEDRPPPIPATQPPRPRARATFYVDNAHCLDPVDVWIDGAEVGQVAPGRRSALVADGGERTLCLLVPGAAQCGDRGTVRQVYLHDGWSVTMHCRDK